jgi:allantoinase
VLNYEEGGEQCVLHGDAHSESVLTDVGGEPLPNARNLNVESNFEYGSRVGFWEIMRILRECGVEATIYAVGWPWSAIQAWSLQSWTAASKSPAMASVGSTTNSLRKRRNAPTCCATSRCITRLIGRRPVGWYTGRPRPNTRRLVVQNGGFLYDSDAYNDDLPYWTRVGGRTRISCCRIPSTITTAAAARRRLRHRR